MANTGGQAAKAISAVEIVDEGRAYYMAEVAVSGWTRGATSSRGRQVRENALGKWGDLGCVKADIVLGNATMRDKKEKKGAFSTQSREQITGAKV